MNYYIDIQVLPDPEFNESTLLNALFSKLHRELVSIDADNIGVSFPSAKKTLGNYLRLHGSDTVLNTLMKNSWLMGLNDYLNIGVVSSVPKDCQYHKVSRVQVKSSAARLLRRSVKKGWITEAQAQQRLADSQDQQSTLPYLQMKSQSTGQHFKLFIQQGKPQHSHEAGSFNAYGLSHTATVPTF